MFLPTQHVERKDIPNLFYFLLLLRKRLTPLPNTNPNILFHESPKIAA